MHGTVEFLQNLSTNSANNHMNINAVLNEEWQLHLEKKISHLTILLSSSSES